MKPRAYFRIYDELVRALIRWIPYTEKNWEIAVEKVGGSVRCLPNGSTRNTIWVGKTQGRGSWDYAGTNGRTITLAFVGVLE